MRRRRAARRRSSSRALAALRRAGDRALSVHGFGAAARYYGSALALVDEHGLEWPRLVLGRTVARFRLGEADPAELTKIADALLGAGAVEPAAEVLVMCTEAAWHAGEREASVAASDRAMALVAEAGPSPARAAVLASSARYTMLAGHHERAAEIARTALPLVEELGLVDLEISLRNSLGGARTGLGETEGIEDLEAAVRLAEEVGSPEAARAYNNLAAVISRNGDLRRSSELHERGLAVSRRFGLGAMERFSRGNRAGSTYALGDWDRALRQADDFLAEIEAGSPHYLEHTNRFTRALIRLGRDDVEGALDDTARALEHARSNPEPQARLPALAVRGFVLDDVGRDREAEELLREFYGLIMDTRSGRVPFGGPPEIVWMCERFGLWAGLSRHFAFAPTRLLEAGDLLAARDFAGAVAVYADLGLRTNEARVRLIAGQEYRG